MTLSDIELAMSNIRDSGGVRRAAEILFNGTPRSGFVALGGATTTVNARWVNINTLIVVTPFVAGTGVLSVSPSDYVVGTSFKIKSTDAADSRGVTWMAMINKPGTGGNPN